MKRFIGVFILLIISTLSLVAQGQPEERIKTIDGEIYIGQVVMETKEVVKIIIKKQTIVNIKKITIVSRELVNHRIRNHMISGEFSNYYLSTIGLNYDVNLYRYNNYLIGATFGVGVAGLKVGTYGAYRLKSQDSLKGEIGVGSTAQWSSTYTGPYAELAYRSQRDNRPFYWEFGIGSILDLSERNGSLTHINIGVGLSF